VLNGGGTFLRNICTVLSSFRCDRTCNNNNNNNNNILETKYWFHNQTLIRDRSLTAQLKCLPTYLTEGRKFPLPNRLCRLLFYHCGILDDGNSAEAEDS
jgi:hypothetical protein